jgi:hypothetical protein
MNTPLSTGEAVTSSADTYDVQPRQVAYVPKSKGFSTQTLIPFNMASAAQQALEHVADFLVIIYDEDLEALLRLFFRFLGLGLPASLAGFFFFCHLRLPPVSCPVTVQFFFDPA